ncbi:MULTISPECIES: N-acetylglucosamine-6-phosphate deacetylase [Streptomyces]|uniref:N-acetylglucosamine-6-phosphate deacetylase n=1 Tax=Streptomyces coelicolor (strain ATCC BAA-471 / A3(2) / M145) TaxID=100226 RepID=Q9KXV7_STRCO|nr:MULTISPECIES: N-acetylglucosamine-6-phosphate deacetylase [Streptomyces]WTC10301.1 N-acetylglucosamine-6-phosphate deacetylase [Streptomyces anthocyanicus]MDX2927969.1 N-acetylglucosamine-6-phosphate deacetylase [Streptomyces sp. NRRL_B-16638]MYU43806.1 N-acetylglucosamine-6-phosphate deacetylase [Streptomyces sp. SID7813]NSL83233.1 N-acetylglucosamine-6-phosphate deacetylase [Streptomyces coelicolor]QFI44243.1 N-acetylglucosamine-6-phosphate deacetylase [Streptomyces coelicolor A3(2)]
MAPSKVLAGARVVLPTGTVDDGRVIVDGARIADTAPPQAETVDLAGHWVVPGFVDIHNHGGGGASFAGGTAEEILAGVETHRRHGTTTVVASAVTGDLDFLARHAGMLAELAQQGDIVGIHFEGPFISPCRKGAHDEQLLRDPDPAEVRKLVDAAHGHAKMMTLATELPGGLDSVRLLVEHGVIAAVGHTDATYEQTVQAIDAGATVATHLFNAMPPVGHRAPGPITALLEDERITVELINDGTHLHPAALQLAFHHAGAARVAFITDAMDAAGFGDGHYLLGPLEVEVADGVARLVEGGSIAGSTLTLDRAFKRAVTVDRLPVGDVVAAISANPARLLGLDDRIGSLEPGKDADLVVLDDAFDLVGVMRRGEWVVDPHLG